MAIGLLFASCVTVPPLFKGNERFERVLEAPGVPRDVLYTRVNEWFVLTFNDPESVIQFSEREAGKVMGKYVLLREKLIGFDYVPWFYRQTISVDVKEEAVRFVVSDPSVSGPKNPYLEGPLTLEDVRVEWARLATSLEEHIKKDDAW